MPSFRLVATLYFPIWKMNEQKKNEIEIPSFWTFWPANAFQLLWSKAFQYLIHQSRWIGIIFFSDLGFEEQPWAMDFSHTHILMQIYSKIHKWALKENTLRGRGRYKGHHRYIYGAVNNCNGLRWLTVVCIHLFVTVLGPIYLLSTVSLIKRAAAAVVWRTYSMSTTDNQWYLHFRFVHFYLSHLCGLLFT